MLGIVLSVFSQITVSVIYLTLVISIVPISQYDRLTIYFYPVVYIVINLIILYLLYITKKAKRIIISFGITGLFTSMVVFAILVLVISNFNR